MKVAVTGASGYIGKHVVDALVELGHDVIAVDIINNNINSKAKFKKIDIFGNDVYEKMEEPDACIHLAWKDGFSHNSDAHMGMLSDHYNFIKSMLNSKIKYFSVMGSMHEVGYFEGAIDENTPTNPLSMYGIAKNSLREAALLLAKDTETAFMWLRAFYILGDDIHNNSIFSKITKLEKEGEKKFPFVSGKNKYDFINVDVLAKQIAIASTQNKVTGIINCCSGKPVSIGEKVVEYIREHNYAIEPDFGKFPEREYDSPAIWGNNEKIKKIIENYHKGL